jgi:hypothetical protein
LPVPEDPHKSPIDHLVAWEDKGERRGDAIR